MSSSQKTADLLGILAKRSEVDAELRRKEVEIKKEEVDLQKKRLEQEDRRIAIQERKLDAEIARLEEAAKMHAHGQRGNIVQDGDQTFYSY